MFRFNDILLDPVNLSNDPINKILMLIKKILQFKVKKKAQKHFLICNSFVFFSPKQLNFSTNCVCSVNILVVNLNKSINFMTLQNYTINSNCIQFLLLYPLIHSENDYFDV